MALQNVVCCGECSVHLRKTCILLLLAGMLSVCFRSEWSVMLCKSSVSLLIYVAVLASRE